MIRRECNLMDIFAVCCDLRADEWDQIEKFGGRAHDIDATSVSCFQFPGPKWAYTNEAGRQLLVGGFIPHRTGVYASWFLATAYAWENHAYELTREAIDRKAFMFQSGAHRVETVCLSSRTAAHAWYKKVGSVFESTLKSYCIDGSDAAMFVETRRKH